MKEVTLVEAEDHLKEYLRAAEKEEILITRDGRPAGMLIGFASEDDWFDYQLESDRRFLRRVETARKDLRAGRGVRLEDLPD
jgi:prevent-host-death family protein